MKRGDALYWSNPGEANICSLLTTDTCQMIPVEVFYTPDNLTSGYKMGKKLTFGIVPINIVHFIGAKMCTPHSINLL